MEAVPSESQMIRVTFDDGLYTIALWNEESMYPLRFRKDSRRGVTYQKLRDVWRLRAINNWITSRWQSMKEDNVISVRSRYESVQRVRIDTRGNML